MTNYKRHPKRNNFDVEVKSKSIKHIPTCFRLLLHIRFIVIAFILKNNFVKGGTTPDLLYNFCLDLDQPSFVKINRLALINVFIPMYA